MNWSYSQEDRRVQRTKKSINKAFLKLLKNNEYNKITVTNIVELANYNRTTFYRHYSGKEQFVEILVNKQVNELIKAFKSPYSKRKQIDLYSLSPTEITIFDHILINKEFYQLWHKFIRIDYFEEKFLKAIAHFYKNEIILVKPVLPGLNIDLYTTFYAHGILALILDWIKNGLKEPPIYMAEQLCKVLNYHPSKSYLNKPKRKRRRVRL